MRPHPLCLLTITFLTCKQRVMRDEMKMLNLAMSDCFDLFIGLRGHVPRLFLTGVYRFALECRGLPFSKYVFRAVISVSNISRHHAYRVSNLATDDRVYRGYLQSASAICFARLSVGRETSFSKDILRDKYLEYL